MRLQPPPPGRRCRTVQFRLAFVRPARQPEFLPKHRVKKLLLIAGLNLMMLLCVSCAFYSTPVKRAGEINKNHAILYGRFYYGHHFAEEPNPAWYTAGVWIRNETTDRTQYIELREKNAVYAVQVEPGSYRITGLVKTDNEHGVKGRITFPATNQAAWLARTFDVRKGERIYIGDYQGETKLDYPILTFKLRYITNNFAATTAEFRNNYPELMTTTAASIFDRSFRER